MPVQACGSHSALMSLVSSTRQSLKHKGSSGLMALKAFEDKLAEANQCKNQYPGHPELIRSCKAQTVNEALWNAGVRTGPVVNSSCNGRKGPTVNAVENWSGNIYTQKIGGRSLKTKRSAKNKRTKSKRNGHNKKY
jgi:hypothetical protein